MASHGLKKPGPRGKDGNPMRRLCLAMLADLPNLASAVPPEMADGRNVRLVPALVAQVDAWYLPREGEVSFVDAATELGVSRQRVAQLVEAGKLVLARKADGKRALGGGFVTRASVDERRSSASWKTNRPCK
jgi:hypothetical protein